MKIRLKCQYPIYLFVGVVFSALMHGLILISWGVKEDLVGVNDHRNDFFIELVSKATFNKQNYQNQLVHEVKEKKASFDIVSGLDKVQRLQSGSPFSMRGVGPVLGNYHIKRGLRNNILKSIQNKISPFWHRSRPPSVGHVELCLKVNTDGTISSLWIKELYGSFQLAEFVSQLIYESAPFVQAMSNMSAPLIVECIFHITPRSLAKN